MRPTRIVDKIFPEPEEIKGIQAAYDDEVI
jgi:hypothetical protein